MQGNELCSPNIFVADTTILLAGFIVSNLCRSGIIVTTSKVVNEVLDKENALKLNMLIDAGLINIVDPHNKYVNFIREFALRVGELISLSETDISLLALALQLSKECKHSNVVILSDDYAVENIAQMLGIEFRPLRTYGIKTPRRYIVKCPACGFTANNYSLKYCPRCGHRLTKKCIETS